MLLALLLAPLVAALLAFLASSKDGEAGFRLPFVLSLAIAGLGLPLIAGQTPAPVSYEWFSLWGTGATVHLSLASDGLSAWMIQLVTWLTPLAILGSRRAAGTGIRDFAAALLAMEGLMIGALLSRDLVVFYLCYEGMLIPMLVLIALFGGAERRAASLWFFLYTMAGSVLMLVGIWFLAWKLGSTDLAVLSAKVPAWLAANHTVAMTLPLVGEVSAATLLFLAFLAAFAVKVPFIPLHSWQEITYAETPAGALVMLAGAMTKIGVYGLIVIVLPLFPQQCNEWAWTLSLLALIGLIGGALVALAQDDIKRLFAWASLSHLSLVVIGVFSGNAAAQAGVPVMLVAHGLSTAAIFLLIGMIEQRAAVRGLADFGGLTGVMPRFAVLFLGASLANVALPGTVNFVGEFLLLLATFAAWGIWIAAIAGLSVILGAVYILRAVQRWLYGPRPAHLDKLIDLSTGEVLAVAPLLLLALVFGFYPRPIIAQTEPVMKSACAPLLQAISTAPTASATTTAPAAIR